MAAEEMWDLSTRRQPPEYISAASKSAGAEAVVMSEGTHGTRACCDVMQLAIWTGALGHDGSPISQICTKGGGRAQDNRQPHPKHVLIMLMTGVTISKYMNQAGRQVCPQEHLTHCHLQAWHVTWSLASL